MPQFVIIILIVVGSLLVLGLLFSVFFTFLVAYKVYSKTLMRGKAGSWGREQCSEPGNPALETMWKRGVEWSKGDKSFIKEVSITSKDGLKLVGEWFDYGFDRTIIILPGRRETLVYSYYYAQPYKNLGFNVLVIDQRAHGLSEGTYSTCGILEAEDVKLWLKYMHDEHDQKEMYIHGICVGTCVTSIVVATFKEPYLKAVIMDSAFITYKEIYKNHYIESGHALFGCGLSISLNAILMTQEQLNTFQNLVTSQSYSSGVPKIYIVYLKRAKNYTLLALQTRKKLPGLKAHFILVSD